MLRVKQANDLNFFTAKPTSPLPPLPGCQFFMKFRGPKAHPNRPQKTMACPTQPGPAGLFVFWPRTRSANSTILGNCGVAGIAPQSGLAGEV